jgi:hypothetical protein
MSTGHRDTGMPNTYQPNPIDDRKVTGQGNGEAYRALASAIEECETVQSELEARVKAGGQGYGGAIRSTRRAVSALRTAAFVLAARTR